MLHELQRVNAKSQVARVRASRPIDHSPCVHQPRHASRSELHVAQRSNRQNKIQLFLRKFAHCGDLLELFDEFCSVVDEWLIEVRLLRAGSEAGSDESVERIENRESGEFSVLDEDVDGPEKVGIVESSAEEFESFE